MPLSSLMTTCFLALTFALILVQTASAATCAKRDKVVAQLEGKYAEQLTAGGLHATDTKTTLVEVWTSPETGTFTVLLTNPAGLSCVVASGTDWFNQKPADRVKGVPS